LRRIGDTGIDALILVTNRFTSESGTSAQWRHALEHILNGLEPALPLGLYECPYPYKYLLTDEDIAFCGSTGRFQFLKDTCCDIEILRRRLKILEGSPLRLYNANTTTLLESYRLGAAGFSGVMANFHPELYVLLSQIWQDTEGAAILQSFLTTCSRIESQLYPVNAKYHLRHLGIGITTRSKNHMDLTETFKDEVRQMHMLTEWFIKEYSQ